MKKFFGWFILALVFGVIFVGMMVQTSFLIALGTFVLALVICGLIWLAVSLIS